MHSCRLPSNRVPDPKRDALCWGGAGAGIAFVRLFVPSRTVHFEIKAKVRLSETFV